MFSYPEVQSITMLQTLLIPNVFAHEYLRISKIYK